MLLLGAVVERTVDVAGVVVVMEEERLVVVVVRGVVIVIVVVRAVQVMEEEVTVMVLVQVQMLLLKTWLACFAVAADSMLPGLVQRTGPSMSGRTSSCRPRHAGLVDLVGICSLDRAACLAP